MYIGKHLTYDGMITLYRFYNEELDAANELMNEVYAHPSSEWFVDHLLDIGWLEGQTDIARRAMVCIEAEARSNYWEYRYEEFHPTPILFEVDDEEIII